MSINKSMHSYSYHYKLNNHILKHVEENPHLDVTVPQNVKFANKINKISNKANSILRLIKHSAQQANRDLRETAYN